MINRNLTLFGSEKNAKLTVLSTTEDRGENRPHTWIKIQQNNVRNLVKIANSTIVPN